MNDNKFSTYQDEVDNLVENYDVVVTSTYDGVVYAFK